MVTLISQNLTEFDLHARAILGLPIPKILYTFGASAVVLGTEQGRVRGYTGINDAMQTDCIDVRIFGKEESRLYRRMGVVLGRTLDETRAAAQKIQVIIG
jgi:phosphoribosylglycinamide formyltransferase 2